MPILTIADADRREKRQIWLMAVGHFVRSCAGQWLARWPRGAGIAASACFFVAMAAYGKALSDGPHFLHRLAGLAGFGLETVRIEGLNETSQNKVLNVLDITADTSLLFYDHQAARKRLEALQWAERVAIAKHYPNTLQIRFREKMALARWYVDGQVVLISREGTPIRAPVAAHNQGLPLLVGAGVSRSAAAIVDAAALVTADIPPIRAFQFVSQRRWNIVLANGITVLLPETDYDAALLQLADLQRRAEILERDIERVDLRLPDRVVIRLSPASAIERRRQFGIVEAASESDA